MRQLHPRILHEGRGPLPPLVRMALAPASWAYGGVIRLRGLLYRRGWIQARQVPGRVVSVGNLTAGGTGKTSFVLLVARLLLQRGFRVAIVARGYGGQREGHLLVVSDGKAILASYPEVGDELQVVAERLPTVPVLMAADRVAGCREAIGRFGADLILVDDGFQHLRLARDLNILLLDARNPFGYGALLPRGLLREPRSAMSRADIVVITGVEEGTDLSTLLAAVRRHNPHAPICQASYRAVGLEEPAAGTLHPWSRLREEPVLAFAGLGNPESFHRTLQEVGARLAGYRVFPDHHRYSGRDLERLVAGARRRGAGALVTTKKDEVRLRRLPCPIPLLVLTASLEVQAGQEALQAALNGLVGRGVP